MDRYNHDLAGEDTDDTDDTPVIGSFSSYTPQYRKQHYSWSRVASTTTVSSSTTNTATPTLNVNITTASITSTITSSSTLAEAKLQATESSSSPTNTVDSVAKCRKIAAPLAASHNVITQQLVNKVLNTPQLRKIEVS